MPLRPCTECGEPHDGAGRCLPCRRATDASYPRASATRRGYNAAWDRLSRRARQLQRFCTDCGATTDLTTDHSPEAWERVARGLAVRLQDVEVVCRGCNARRGRARPTQTQGGCPSDQPRRTRRLAALRVTHRGTMSHSMGHSDQEVGM